MLKTFYNLFLSMHKKPFQYCYFLNVIIHFLKKTLEENIAAWI